MKTILGTIRNGQIVADQPLEWPEGCRVAIEPLKEETLKNRFNELAAIWHRETAYLSSMTEASNHPAYLEIIRLGPDVIPLLLCDMEAHHTHWFAALRALTKAEPIRAEDAGNIPKMVSAWLAWAKENGYQW
jgi:hypothetical protein